MLFGGYDLSSEEDKLLDVLERASKSVVNISTVKLVHAMFYQVVPVRGVGSGTIIDSRGFILTNNHVIRGARKISVTLWSGEVFEGEVIGSCSLHDIALVKVDGGGLPAAELGDSDKLRVGQRVYAIGNPFGLAGGPTVTSGVISALNRTIEAEEGLLLENLVQTDAAINPGNSGGPLVDVNGRVVAINTAIVPFAQGIGFAIPINTAKRCSEEIISGKGPLRPWIGIIGLSLTKDVAQQYNLPLVEGVLVTRVIEGGPAYRAGIEAGDIILRLDGVRIKSIEDLLREIHRKRVGDNVRLDALKKGVEWSGNVTLSEML